MPSKKSNQPDATDEATVTRVQSLLAQVLSELSLDPSGIEDMRNAAYSPPSEAQDIHMRDVAALLPRIVVAMHSKLDDMMQSGDYALKDLSPVQALLKEVNVLQATADIITRKRKAAEATEATALAQRADPDNNRQPPGGRQSRYTAARVDGEHSGQWTTPAPMDTDDVQDLSLDAIRAKYSTN